MLNQDRSPGVSYKEVKSYPVGFEETIHMFPMDFEEFLYANGIKKETVEYLRNCFKEQRQVSDSVHRRSASCSGIM